MMNNERIKTIFSKSNFKKSDMGLQVKCCLIFVKTNYIMVYRFKKMILFKHILKKSVSIITQQPIFSDSEPAAYKIFLSAH